MAADPGQTLEASVGSIHNGISSRRLRHRLRSLLLDSSKPLGRSLSLDSPSCLESQVPFLGQPASSHTQRAATRLSRHRHKHTLSDSALLCTSTPPPPPTLSSLSRTSRISCAHFGGSLPSMGKRALRKSDRDTGITDVTALPSTERGSQIVSRNKYGLQLLQHGESRCRYVRISVYDYSLLHLYLCS